MKTAVIISTYNGIKYLKDQLDSIRNQTVSPDEVIIGDDKSSDNTVDYIKDYISEYSLNWTLIVNEENVGWKKNFYNLIDQCTSDLIFLSDQDDVWNIHKIELMTPVFDNPEIDVLVSKWTRKWDDIDPVFSSIENNTTLSKINFDTHYLYGIAYPGCAFCFRKSFFNSIKPFYKDFLPHDAFIYRYALLSDSLYKINQNLLIHRYHSSNASRRSYSDLKSSIEYYRNVNALLVSATDVLTSDINKEKYQKIISKGKQWNELRNSFFEKKNPFTFLSMMKYISFYPKFKTYIKDLFIAYKG